MVAAFVALRSREAICCSVLTAIPGCSCINPRKTHSVSPSNWTSDVAVTVAVRGPPSRSAISPKKSPGPSLAPLPPIVTSAVPSTITNSPTPAHPRERSPCPRGGRCPSRRGRSSRRSSGNSRRTAGPARAVSTSCLATVPTPCSVATGPSIGVPPRARDRIGRGCLRTARKGGRRLRRRLNRRAQDLNL